MARRPRKPPEEQEPPAEQVESLPAAITDPIEVDLGDEPEIAAPIAPNGNGAATPTPSEPAPTPPPVVEPPQDDLRKRLSDMEAAQAQSRQREAELARQNAELQRQMQQASASALQDRYDSAINTIGALQEQIDAAKGALRSAGTEGNWEAIADAQERIGRLSAQLQSAEAYKSSMDAEREQVSRQPPPQQQQPQQQGDPVEAAIAAYPIPDKAKNWLRGHREYLLDPEKNAAMQHYHHQARREAGEFTDGYFERMETLLGLRQPAPTPAPQPSPQPAAPAPAIHVSAPPTRDVPSMTTGQPQPKRVTLSAEQREIASTIAQSRGISQQEAEKEYAKQLLKLQQLKAQGHYPG